MPFTVHAMVVAVSKALAPKFLMVTFVVLVPVVKGDTGALIIVMPASHSGGVYSSAPISGLAVSLGSPSISLGTSTRA